MRPVLRGETCVEGVGLVTGTGFRVGGVRGADAGTRPVFRDETRVLGVGFVAG